MFGKRLKLRGTTTTTYANQHINRMPAQSKKGIVPSRSLRFYSSKFLLFLTFASISFIIFFQFFGSELHIRQQTQLGERRIVERREWSAGAQIADELGLGQTTTTTNEFSDRSDQVIAHSLRGTGDTSNTDGQLKHSSGPSGEREGKARVVVAGSRSATKHSSESKGVAGSSHKQVRHENGNRMESVEPVTSDTVWEKLLPIRKNVLKVYVYRDDPYLDWRLLFKQKICWAASDNSHGIVKGLSSDTGESDEFIDVLNVWQYHIHSDDFHTAQAVTSEQFRTSKWYTDDPLEADVLVVPALMSLFFAVEVNIVNCEVSFETIGNRTASILESFPHYQQTKHKHYFSMGHYGFRGRMSANEIPKRLYDVISKGWVTSFETQMSGPGRCRLPALYVGYPCSHPKHSRMVSDPTFKPMVKHASVKTVNKQIVGEWKVEEDCYVNGNCAGFELVRPIDVGFRAAMDLRTAYHSRRRYCDYLAEVLLDSTGKSVSNPALVATCISTSPMPGIARPRRTTYYEEKCSAQNRTVACTATGQERTQQHYCAELQSSRFTAFHKGDSPTSSRYAEAIIAGSIPLVFIRRAPAPGSDQMMHYEQRLARGIPWRKMAVICDFRSDLSLTHDKCLAKISRDINPTEFREVYKKLEDYAKVIDFWYQDGIPATVFGLYQLARKCE